MQLVGMLDSPYVRRVAVSLQLLGLPFEHRSISVFRTFPQFQAINPVVKAPTVVCDDGEVLMDSTLILDYAEALAAGRRSLMPAGLPARQHALRAIGLALAALDKSIQIVYEHELRPEDKRHGPWIERVTGQLLAACTAMESDLGHRPLGATPATLCQAGVTTAVAWTFLQAMVPDRVPAASHPRLSAFAAECEALPAFAAAPHGPDTVRPS
jgi:glutathione S-transferase